MLISDVKTAVKFADLIIGDKPNKYFDIVWDESVNQIFKLEYDRVYIIVENGVIKKIGGSSCKGGFQKTITTYRDSSISGKPSPRTIGIPFLINKSLLDGNKIEIYGIIAEPVLSKITGLFDIEERYVTPNYKHLELKCINDYKDINGKYPEWNFQENKEEWPDVVNELHLDLLNRANENKKSKKDILNENTN